jgi:hypothetical protein
MGPVIRLTLCLLLLALGMLAGGASAQSPGDDRRGVRAVVSAQFEAFADDDADAAFATATPTVRSAMGHPLRFLAMVRGTYPMLLKPASIRFLDTELQGRHAFQLVRLTDTQGRPWLALFALERQADQSWRIAGCSVSEARWQPA